jgi:hypothetical protein
MEPSKLQYEFDKAALELAKVIAPLGYELSEFAWGPYGLHTIKIHSVKAEVAWSDIKRRENNLLWVQECLDANEAS